MSSILSRIVFALLCLLPFATQAQTLSINNDIQSYATLTSTAVTMTGKSELRITGTSSPITGSVINLNSADAWFFMTGIAPSTITSTYLSQVRVNGAVAAAGTNCRVAQYGDGTVVIPQSPTFAAMTVYTGKMFTGSSMNLTPYTAYGSAALGAFDDKISSFKLKRGYTATVAQNSAGSGVSRNYVAADGDLEVSILPDELNESVSFIRIFPWRWATKKGIAGDIAAGLNVKWDYNWNLNRNSTPDIEYVPIRAQRWWPDLNQNWQTHGSDHLLGYNEPDSTSQSNIAVGDAIWSWPDLLATGLRVGSPAPTDGGLSSWLYPFMAQADTDALRVDFVALHYYRCYDPTNPSGAATQFYNFLKGVYDQTKRPIWITEWNQGANWTGCTDPTAAQHQAAIAAMIDMLDSTPFVERYSIYNWVEDVRRVKWDDGSLTASGTTYRDKVSPIGYVQEIPEAPTPAGALFRFEDDARDSSGNGHNAVLHGTAKFAAGHTGRAVSLSGSNGDYVTLSPKIGDSADFTFGGWVYWKGGANWQRIFDLGDLTDSYMFLTPSSDSGTPRFGIKKSGGTEQQLNSSLPFETNKWTHVAVTISGNTGKLFVNGSLVATNTAMTYNPVDLGTRNNFLGKSQYAADPLFAGLLDDVQFLPYALADAKIATMMANTPPQFSQNPITGAAGTQGVAYSGTLAGFATDANAGDTLTFSKGSGPAWLAVAANGTLSGTPTYDDAGLQEFTVYVTDSAGASAAAVLNITLPAVLGNGTWTSAGAGGNWGDSTKWSNSFPANGAGNTANFSTLDITSDLTVTLERSRSIGSLSFGDTAGAQGWFVGNANGATLTLDAAAPTITVNQNTATMAAALAGTAGLTKAGAGTLILSGDNAISGTLNVDAGLSSGNGGILRISNPDAVTDFTAIAIRNNNSGSSTLELDGATRSIVSAAPISLSGRNAAIISIRSLAGTNSLSGGLTLFSGGGNFLLQSDTGTLSLGGNITSTAGGTRTLTFQGAGSFAVPGTILDGTTTVTVLALTKTGAGTLTLNNGNSTFSGNIVISGGNVIATAPAAINLVNATKGPLGNPQTAARTITVQSGATLTFGIGNVLGSGGSSTPPVVSLVINQGGLVKTDATAIAAGGPGGGDANIFGPITLNGGTFRTGNGYSTAWQAAILTGTVTAAGALPSTIDTNATNTVANALSLGKGGGGTITFDVGSGGLTISAPLANAANNTVGALTKIGAGTLTLNAANTHTGATTVTAGTLSVNGSIVAGGTVTVANGASLSGLGTISATTTINGTHKPGAAIGSQSFGTLSYGSTGRLQWELGVNSIAAGSCDKVVASGPVSITSGAALDLAFNSLGGAVAFNDPFWTQPRSWTILSAPSISGAFAVGTISADAAGRSVTDYGTLTVQQSSTAVTLNFIPYTASQLWQKANFGANWNNPSIAGDMVDREGDGLPNLLEYALASDPNASNPAAAPQVTTLNGKLTISFTRNVNASDLSLIVVGSDSPAGPWSELARSSAGQAVAATAVGVEVSESGTGGTRSVQVSDVYPANDPAHSTRFLRLRVER